MKTHHLVGEIKATCLDNVFKLLTLAVTTESDEGQI